MVALSDAGVWSTRIGPHQPLMTPRHVTTDGAPRDLGRFGLAYHPESRLFVAWDGNRGVWTLDPADWSWTEYPNPDGPAPFATSSNGVFGRRRYDPELDAFRRQPRVRDATKAIWVAKGDDTMTENVAFSGMAVPDRNGAGIRHEGRDLTLRRVLMEDGEEGLLAAVRPDGNVRQLQNRVNGR